MRRPKDRTTIGGILSAINRHEHDEGRPLLSAVVLLTRGRVPGNGFYRSARELGFISWQDGRRFWQTELGQRYWRDELSSVHRHWLRP